MQFRVKLLLAVSKEIPIVKNEPFIHWVILGFVISYIQLLLAIGQSLKRDYLRPLNI